MSKRIVITLAFTSLSLFALSDTNMESVESQVDVNARHFDIIVGLNFDETNYETNEEANTFTKTLQLDYYSGDFSLQASTQYYDSESSIYDDSGIGDTFLGAYYKLRPDKNFSVRLGLGVLFPTYDSIIKDNNTDYIASIALNYMLNDINLFGGYAHTIVNDEKAKKNALPTEYQNTNAYNVGAGFYYTSKLYVSAAYNNRQSIYRDVDEIQTLSANAFYTIDKNWFTTFTYAHGLSESASDNAASVRVGYYF